jgi:integral membrane protein (TIGR00529 family)
MDLSEFFPVFGKLAGSFAAILVMLRLRVPLWLAIIAGSAVIAFTCGIAATDWCDAFIAVLQQKDFLPLCLMIFLILLLSGVQEATGQSRMLVEGLEKYLQRPRVRLVIYPALVGMLPMPGGALFSCPMIKAASRDMDLTGQKKALINYWFRHIWELSWPLYPGYVLACALLDIPLSRLCQLTFPLVPLSLVVGWLFFMRDMLPARDREHEPARQTQNEEKAIPTFPDDPPSLRGVLRHALPLIVALLGSLICTLFFNAFLPYIPSQFSFSLALLCAIGTALWQGRKRRRQPLLNLLFTANVRKILLLLFAIFVFKHIITASGLLQSLGKVNISNITVILSCMLLPFAGGMLTGIMVGFVGMAFPILIGLINQSALQEYTVPLIILGLISGNAGQLLSPLHVCLVVTCEFFTTPIAGMLRVLFLPVCFLFGGSVLWVLTIMMLGIRL